MASLFAAFVLSYALTVPASGLSNCCGQVDPAIKFLSAMIEALPANMQVTYVIFRVRLCEGQTGEGVGRDAFYNNSRWPNELLTN